MRAITLAVLSCIAMVPAGIVACGSSSNGSNSSPQGGGDGGSDAIANEGGSDGGLVDTGSDSKGTETGPGTDGPFVRADHLPFPQVIWQDGPVMTAPAVVSVTFAGDPNVSTYDQLGQGIASSMWWNTVRSGYCEGDGGACVGDGPAGVSVQLSMAASPMYTDAQIQALLKAQIMNGTLPMPDATMPVSNTVYVVYFPGTTTVDDGSGSTSCSAFDGYHNAFTIGSQQIPYAVIDECDYGSPAATLAATTGTTGHEVIEAATNPGTPTGYYLDFSDPNTWGWNDVQAGEVADMCDDIYGLGGDKATDGTFTVQRIWSNALAAAGGDPCAPVPAGSVYFNASPSQAVYVLPVGGSVTFEASAFSTGPMSDWVLSAQDFTDYTTQYLSFSIQGGTATDAGPIVMVNNGAKPKITVTLLADPGGTTNGEADGVLLSTIGDPANPTADHDWPFIVVTPADAMDAGIDAAISMRPHVPRPFNRWTRRGPDSRRSGPTAARSLRW